MRSTACLVICGLLCLCGTLARAAIPDPEDCSVEPCDTIDSVTLCPHRDDPGEYFAINVHLADHGHSPIPYARVEVILGYPNAHYVCPAAQFVYYADANGDARLTLPVGGCVLGEAGAFVIRVEGVDIRSYGDVRSPDFDGSQGDGQVTLADFMAFGAERRSCSGEDCCFDFNNNGVMELADQVVFSAGWGRGCWE